MTNIDLSAMTEAQKRDLYSALSFELRPGSKTVQTTPDQDLIWSAINDVVGHKRALGETLSKAGKNYSMSSFKDDVEYICGWIDAGCSNRLNRAQRTAIINMGVTYLGKQIAKSRTPTPVIHKTLMQQLTKVPAVLDKAFPGYQQARILDRVVCVAA